ncbi:MAG: TetR/AcrR family transcriptional regulator [Desulfomonilaceae bacterium]|nr:TetR/AcrR family transcriptional regulator [Desulfomonilaceae bacterium]
MEHTFKILPEEKREFILSAAARVFAKNGYYHANVAEICKQAGISNGALYKYFKNKEAVYRSIFEVMVDTLHSRLFAKHVGSDASVYEIISEIFRDLVDLARTHADFLAIYTDVGSCAMNELSPSVSRKLEEGARGFWIDLVRKGKETGEIKKHVMDEAAAYYFDNHLNLLIYSLASRHFDMRLQMYFGSDDEKIADEEKARLLMKSVKMILS